MKYIKQIYLAIIFLFLYAPIAVLIAQSFNASRYRGHWTGLTLDWYTKLFNDDRIVNALSNTLSIGLLSASIATILGLITCVAMKEFSRKWRATFMSVTNIPILNADIVTGISLMLLFLGIGLKLGYVSILLAHIVFNVTYVILCIMPQL
ncbi:MAG: ABC transporter permease, partial [Selenomonadaceae bacterium]|nr:ABC transporter permease [Selenomonadaceae bacterium]